MKARLSLITAVLVMVGLVLYIIDLMSSVETPGLWQLMLMFALAIICLCLIGYWADHPQHRKTDKKT